MPHITIELSPELADFDAAQALERVNTALMRSGQFEEADIKARVLRLDETRIGVAATSAGFIHATLKLLSGRSVEVRSALSASVLEALVGGLPKTTGHARTVQVSVEVVEIDRASYAKQVVA